MGKSDPSDLSEFCVRACTSACSRSDYIFKQGAVTRPALGMQTAILETAPPGLQDPAFCKFFPSRWVIYSFVFKHNTFPSSPLFNFILNHSFFSLRKSKISAKAIQLQFCLDRLQRIMCTRLPFTFPLLLHSLIPTLQHFD